MSLKYYLAVLLFWNFALLDAQTDFSEYDPDEETWVWDEDETDNDYDDEDYNEDYNEDLAQEWNLSDTLSKQYKSRKFRDKWQEDYQGVLFDYEERISKKKPTSNTNWDLSGFFNFLAGLAKIIGYGLIALVVFLVVRALLTDSGISIRSFSRNKASYSTVNESEIDIDEDWRSKAVEAKNRGDLKSAVRYYFMAYLKQLNQQEHIDFHKDKSNREYKYEINDQAIRNEFDVLSRVFDYCWYGDFEIDAEQFTRVELLFDKHLKR